MKNKSFFILLGLFMISLCFFQCENHDPPPDEEKIESTPDSFPEHYRVNVAPFDNGDPLPDDAIRNQEYEQPMTQSERLQADKYHQYMPTGKVIQASYWQPEDPVDEGEDTIEEHTNGWFDWIKHNLAGIISLVLALMALIEIIVQLTPTERDNAWFRWLKNIVSSIIPNNKSSGGQHPQ